MTTEKNGIVFFATMPILSEKTNPYCGTLRGSFTFLIRTD
jgi:hypothetical protein